MLRKIRVDQLKPGMYLKEFCGSWMDHPFWRSGFVLTDPKDIEKVLAGCIREVWIDCSLGKDVDPDEPVVPAPPPPEPLLEENPQPAPTPTAPVARDLVATRTTKEFERAAKICHQAKDAVISMFEEARMGKAVDTGGAKQLVDEISDSIARNPGALISLARLKTLDDYTYMHSVAVCAMMVVLAKNLKMDEAQIRSAGLAGLMHDLGKAMIPAEVLNKPGKLSSAEFDIVKSHPRDGYSLLLTGVGADPHVLDVCLHHHEKTNGSGYPDGLMDKQISVFAKMGAVCDVYDAITSNRPYKSGWDPAESIRQMAHWAKGHFDPLVFQAFVKSLGIYPIGSLVRLSSGRLAVVIDHTGLNLTTPSVKVFYSTKTGMRIPPELVDLSHPRVTEKIACREDPAKWQLGDLNELWLNQ